jgi:hypothetical protein
VDVASDKTPCSLIVVDAFVDGGEKLEGEYPDIRSGVIDRVVDPSWKYAIDALMQRRRSDALKELGIDLEARTNGADFVLSADCANRLYHATVVGVRGVRCLHRLGKSTLCCKSACAPTYAKTRLSGSRLGR